MINMCFLFIAGFLQMWENSICWVIIWNYCHTLKPVSFQWKISSCCSYHSPLIDTSGNNFTTKGIDCFKDAIIKSTISVYRFPSSSLPTNFYYDIELTFEGTFRPVITHNLTTWEFVLIKAFQVFQSPYEWR